MSNAEHKEQGDRRLQAVPEAKALQSQDAQAARVARATDVQAAQDLNKNKHNGSAGGDQELSFELVAYGAEGAGKVVAARRPERVETISMQELILKGRSGDQFASSVVQQMRAADQLPAQQREQLLAKLQDTADKAYGRKDATKGPASDQQDQMDTGAILSLEAKKNPAAVPVSLFKDWVEKEPEGPTKEALRQEVRQQAAGLSPEMQARMAHREELWKKIAAAGLDQGGVYQAVAPEKQQLAGRVEKSEPPTNTTGGWLEAGRQIAQLPLDKQIQVIGAGLIAGVQQYQHDERERQWGQLIGTVQGAGEVLVNLATIAEFSSDVVCGNKARAMERGEQFGKALGETVVSGVRLFQATQKYSYEVGYTGDYGRLFRDLANVGMALNDRWSQLPPREQERIKYKLMTEMAADGLMGAGGAKAIGKAKVFTEVLDAIAIEAKTATKATLHAGKRAAKAIGDVVKDLTQPELALPGGGRMKFRGDFGKSPHVLMSQADDLGGAAKSGRLLLNGKDGTLIKFEKLTHLEISETVGSVKDSHWTGANFLTGWKVEGTLKNKFMAAGEALRSNFPVIDGWSYKDGLITSIKSIDLRATTYQKMDDLERTLRTYVGQVETYEGTTDLINNINIRPERILQRLLHLGIPDGSITPEQKAILEKLARELESSGSDTKIKVTLLR